MMLKRLALLGMATVLGGAPHAFGTPLVYVSLERGNAVVAIDPQAARIVARYNVGQRPRGLALSPDGRSLYVAVSGAPIGGPGVDEAKLPPADHGADGIAVVNLASGRSRSFPGGSDPETFALSPSGKQLFVSNEDAGALSAVPVAGGPSRSAKVGDQPEGVAITRDGRTLYVACEGSDYVAQLDAASLRVEKTIAITGRPRSLLLSRDGRTVFVAVETAGKLALLDAETGRLRTLIDLAHGNDSIRPMGLVEAPGGRLYVSTGRGRSVIEVNVDSGRTVRTIAKVGARPWGIALIDNDRMLATANGPSDDISIIELASGKLKARIATGGGPWGIVW